MADDTPSWASDLPDASAAPAQAPAAKAVGVGAPAWAADLPDVGGGAKAGRRPPVRSPASGPAPTIAPVTVAAPSLYKKAAQAAPPLTWGETLRGAVQNALPSAVETAKAIGHSIVHPIETAKNIGQLGLGLASQAQGVAGVKQDPAQKARTEAVARALEGHYADIYGPLLHGDTSGLKRAIATDPTGIAMDASTLAGGAGLAARAAGLEKAALVASKAASAVDPIANSVRLAKVVTAPAKGGARAVSGAMTGVPSSLMKVATQAGKTSDPALKGAFQRFYTGQGDASEVLQAAQSALAKTRQKASDAYLAKKATLSNAAPSYDPIDAAIAKAREKTRLGGVDVGQFKTPNAAIDEAQGLVDSWKGQTVGPYADPRFQSVAGFDNLKQALGDLRTTYGDDVWREHIAPIYHGVKTAIEGVDPEYAKLMEQYQTARANITDLQKTLVGAGKTPAASTALNKMMRALKTGPGKNLLDQLAVEEPTLPYMLAGHSLSPWGAKGMTGLTEAAMAPAAAITTGAITHDPILALGQYGAHLAASSPKIAGAVNYGAGAADRALTAALPATARVGYYGDRAGEGAPSTPPAPQATAAAPEPDPNEVDAATRMVMSEAGGEPAEGQAAALHTFLNRAKASGSSLTDEITRPYASEAVTTGKASAIDPDDPVYQRIRRDVIIPTLKGEIPDPTGGAQHFLNPDLQRKEGRAIPAWAQGDGVRIGNHVFYPGDLPDAQASGGRVERASGGRVDDGRIDELVEALVRKAKAAKRHENRRTEPLLKASDDTVAKALQIAQAAI